MINDRIWGIPGIPACNLLWTTLHVFHGWNKPTRDAENLPEISTEYGVRGEGDPGASVHFVHAALRTEMGEHFQYNFGDLWLRMVALFSWVPTDGGVDVQGTKQTLYIDPFRDLSRVICNDVLQCMYVGRL